ncbi:MAG: SDR family oxidoreductase [Gemmatimonadales bacterium]|nr:SDR family oxidoreductase [Gemmatimonadales bacterium]
MTGSTGSPLVLVTGASRGIGAAVASHFSTAGWTVIRLARSPMPPLERALDLRVDLAERASRQAALAQLSAEHPVPDVIVNNAGAFLLAPLEESSDDLLHEQLAINLEAPFAIARHFLPLMRSRGHGRHVVVGSIADHHPFPHNAAYATSKFAVRGLHEVIVEEYRGTGVQSTLISPGPTDTAAWDPVDPDGREGFTNRADMLRPTDVADAVFWAATRPAGVHVELVRVGPG